MSSRADTFRFVHTADLHLDSPLKSLASRHPGMAEAVRGATRQALQGIVDLCLDETVDALLIAGDLYDGNQRDMATAAFLRNQFRRLEKADIPIFLIRGNHDSRAHITSELALPANVHGFGGRGGTVELDDHEVAIHGVSFNKPAAPESLLPKYPPPKPGRLNIGLLHTSLSGSGAHDTYAPCALAELLNFGYDYWALGHVHKRQVHTEGSPAVVMPGNPQGRHMGEAGERSVSLVSLGHDGVRIEARTVATTRFERYRIDLDGVDEWTLLERRLEAALEALRQDIATEHLIVRLELHGRTALAWNIKRDQDRLQAVLQLHADTLDGLWLEAVVDQTEAPTADTTTAGKSEDVLGSLTGLIDDSLIESLEFRERVDSETRALLNKLPPELRHCLGADEASTRITVDALLRSGTERLLAELHGEREEADQQSGTDDGRQASD